MKVLSATEAKQSLGEIMTSIGNEEPVTIQKQGKDFAVVLTTQQYQQLKRLEDILYGKAAELAIQEGVLSADESRKVLGKG